jgi:hypothetical protein
MIKNLSIDTILLGLILLVLLMILFKICKLTENYMPPPHHYPGGPHGGPHGHRPPHDIHHP